MKKIICFAFTLLFMTSLRVSAQEIYFENEGGVAFTKEQYDFFTAMYYDGYQKVMTNEDFEKFDRKIMNKDNVETKIYKGYINPMATDVTALNRRLKISKVSSSNVTISMVVDWLLNPSTRSYDLMGAYLNNVSLIGSVTTKLVYSSGSYYVNDIQKNNNGYGVSIKLPESGESIKVTQTFSVSSGGHVYGSYQHAVNNISLSTSKNYTIGYGGYGHVFIFNFGAGSNYDCMQGVDINV